MAGSAPFKLNQAGFMLAMISAAFAGPAGAAAGRVDFVTGPVTVSGPDGRERPLARGANIDNGDTVKTNDGRAQVRFTDGSFVSLQPNTEFGVSEYRYEQKTDGTETGFFSLVKGAMRTVTGAIGRVNRNRYRINTPTATVGIRGTGGLIQVLPDGSTLVLGTSGIWTITNPAGTIDVPAGASGVATPKTDTPPQRTSEAPAAGPTPIATATTPFTQGDQRTQSGTSADVPVTKQITPLVSGSGYAAVVAHRGFGSGQTFPAQTSATAVFDSLGRLSDVMGASDTFHASVPSASANTEFGSDGILAWGRWTGPITMTCGECGSSYTADANQGFHYAIGMPTAVLPTSGGGTYTLMGATSPTYVDGSTAPGTLSGTLSIAFGTTASITADLKATMPDRAYTMQGTTTTRTASFSMGLTVGGCLSACSGTATGLFAGSAAERVGLSYSISDVNKSVIGAAAFKAP